MIVVLGATACEETNPFRNTQERVFSGSSELWELSLDGFPSGWDFPSATRLFVGTSGVDNFTGTFVLDAREDGTLVLVPFSILAAGLSGQRTGIRDLGAVSFDGVQSVPTDGYNSTSDPEGTMIEIGHVYAFRIALLISAVVPINYGKLEVIDIGQQDPADPRSRFIRFRWAYQLQPNNTDLRVEEEG